MPGSRTARDLLLEEVPSVSATAPLVEAVRALRNRWRAEEPAVVLVAGEDGGHLGLLTPRLLLKSMLALWMPERHARRNDDRLEGEVLGIVRDRLRQPVRDLLIRGLPTAAPGDSLARLIEIACDRQLEYLPVVEEGRALGVVPLSTIFHAATALALTPEHEGIRYGGKQRK